MVKWWTRKIIISRTHLMIKQMYIECSPSCQPWSAWYLQSEIDQSIAGMYIRSRERSNPYKIAVSSEWPTLASDWRKVPMWWSIKLIAALYLQSQSDWPVFTTKPSFFRGNSPLSLQFHIRRIETRLAFRLQFATRGESPVASSLGAESLRFHIKNEKWSIKHEKLCIKYDGSCVKRCQIQQMVDQQWWI